MHRPISSGSGAQLSHQLSRHIDMVCFMLVHKAESVIPRRHGPPRMDATSRVRGLTACQGPCLLVKLTSSCSRTEEQGLLFMHVSLV